MIYILDFYKEIKKYKENRSKNKDLSLKEVVLKILDRLECYFKYFLDNIIYKNE